MSKSPSDTPLMQQHRAIKQKYPDAVLLFRVGDFYETFDEDALIASRVLGITLTKRNNGAASSSELAGFPHHALDNYLHKLVKAGYRVAICDQLEDPKQAKGIVRRGVTELVTPGIATHDKLLESGQNNFLASIFFNEGECGMAWADISTGEFFMAQGSEEFVDKMLQTLRPAEVIFQRNHQKRFKERYADSFHTYSLETWVFDAKYATESLLQHFHLHSLKGFGVEGLTSGIIAAGAILHYLKDTEHPHLQHLTRLQRLDLSDFLWMDQFTLRNLELFPSAFPGTHSLLATMDHSQTPMGARMLKRWMLMPLKDRSQIQQRLDLVEFLITEVEFRNQLHILLKACGDLERLSAKIPNRKISPRELVQLAKTLQHLEAIQKNSQGKKQDLLERLTQELDPLPSLKETLLSQLVDPAPATAQKGEMIRAGIHAELDELRQMALGGKDYLNSLQQREAQATGIGSLKIGFNNIFGYYLEVTHAHKEKVPSAWLRKQTLTNAERYITPELKTYEEKITGAEERIAAIEMQLYDLLIQGVDPYLATLQRNAHLLATLDCLCSFAQLALRNNYTKPSVHDGLELRLKESRHPVIERHLSGDAAYIANDLLLDPAAQQIIILTGPNMSGKSALLRQAALIILMAHMGSFVPAAEAWIPLTDKIFTRVGASDNLSAGESTFMVEMNETASIINNLSARSLVLLDEIGRGTSTFDGISIAWSIAEYLHHAPQAPKTLFATHYHELNELENQFPRIRNFHITFKEVGNKVIFLRKLAAGGSTHSFGIHVARMAGMPEALLQKANEILKKLEESRESGPASVSGSLKASSVGPKVQLTIFDAHSETFEQIREKLEAIDIDHLTPVEALLTLQQIKKLLH